MELVQDNPKVTSWEDGSPSLIRSILTMFYRVRQAKKVVFIWMDLNALWFSF